MSALRNMTMTERLDTWESSFDKRNLIDYSEYIEHLDYNVGIDSQGWYYIDRIVLEKHVHKNGKDVYYTLYEERIKEIIHSKQNLSFERVKDVLNYHEKLGELILKAVFLDKEEAYEYINELYPFENFERLLTAICKKNSV